jgi:uncharacterized protein (TIGR03382 family)
MFSLVMLVTIGLSLQAFADTKQLIVTKDDAGTVVMLPVDTVAVIELPSNITTGHYWNLRSTKNKTWRHLGSEHIYPDTELKGAQGIERIYLVGERVGTSEIELLYKRPHEQRIVQSLAYQIASQGSFIGQFEVPKAPEPPPLNYVPTRQDLPAHFNWCEEIPGGCTPVKDQASCGSCWAFGTVGPLEQMIKLNNGVEEDLSEQYLVSCNKDFWTCLLGGQFAHAYHKDRMVDSQSEAGAVLEETFPYDPSWIYNPCGDEDYPKAYRIEDWDYVSGYGMPEVDELKEAMLTYGPVGVCACSNNAISNYSGGVFEGPGCSGTNHIVTMVGWDDGDGAWYIRSSWGTGWGEGGYMRCKYGVSAMGEGATYIVYESTMPRITVSGLEPFLAISGEPGPDDQLVTVTNAQGDPLDWTAVSDQGWLAIQPATGITPTDVTVSVDTSGLTAGTHEANLTFTATGAINSPHSVRVELEYVEVPSLEIPYSASTPALDGVIAEGEYDDASTLDMDPGQPGASQAFAQYDGQYIYLAMDATADLDDDDNDTLAVYFDLDNNGQWPTSAQDEGRFFAFGDGSLEFHPVYNSGSGLETGSPESSPTGLSAEFAVGSDHRVVELRIDITTSRLNLVPGDAFGRYLIYYDHVADDDYDVAGQWPGVMPTMEDCRCFGDTTLGWIEPPEDLQVTPESLSFSALLDGDPSTPTNLNISASEGGALEYTVAASESWLTLSAASGTTPGVVEVRADPAGLAVGTVNATITVTAPSSGNQSVTVPVTFEVTEESLEDLVVDPTSLGLQAEENGAVSDPATLNITGSAGGALDFTAEASDAWIVLSAATGTTPGALDVSADPTGLAVNTYNGTVTISSGQAANGPIAVAVSFEVYKEGEPPDDKESDGCSCGATIPAGPSILLLLALGLLVRRRRS